MPIPIDPVKLVNYTVYCDVLQGVWPMEGEQLGCGEAGSSAL